MITSKFQVPDDDFPAKSSRHRVATEDFLTNKDLSEMKSTKVFSVFCYIKLLSWNLLFIWLLPSHEMNKSSLYAGTSNLSSANHPKKPDKYPKHFLKK